MTTDNVVPLVRRDMIVNILFGSHLYGTSTPNSDFDCKGVYVPKARDILLQRTSQSSIRNERREKAHGEKTQPGEVELEIFTLQRFLALVAEGQTVALDMLFAPEKAHITQLIYPGPGIHWVWSEIIANRHRLISRKAASFVSYCRNQANKYGIKGSRVAAARQALNLLVAAEKLIGGTAKLSVMFQGSRSETAWEHTSFVDIPVADGTVIIRHWEVCGRKMPFTSSIKTAREIMQKLVDEYGQRSLQAESQQGVDWKALSHAVRVGQEAIELLRTGTITLPLPNAAYIRGIKIGDYEYKQVSDEIERLLEEIERAAQESSLPAEPDKLWIDDFVAAVHLRQIEGKL